MKEGEREGDSHTVYSEGHQPTHKDGVGSEGGVNVHYTSALMFNNSRDEVHCSLDPASIPLHTE